MCLEGRIRLELVAVGEVIVERFTADDAADAPLSVLAPEDRPSGGVGVMVLVREFEAASLSWLDQRIACAATAARVLREDLLTDQVVDVAGDRTPVSRRASFPRRLPRSGLPEARRQYPSRVGTRSRSGAKVSYSGADTTAMRARLSVNMYS